jgi:hypothetical protein
LAFIGFHFFWSCSLREIDLLFVAPTASFSKGRAEREVVGCSNYKVRAKERKRPIRRKIGEIWRSRKNWK